MNGPFRITRSKDREVNKDNGGQNNNDGFKQYLDRLLKMIPAEIVALYMIGSGMIPADRDIVLTIWACICFVLVIIIRIYGTADTQNNKPPQTIPIIISSVAFIIWVYSQGGPFARFNLYEPFIGSLAILFWSFVIPIFYKGPLED